MHIHVCKLRLNIQVANSSTYIENSMSVEIEHMPLYDLGFICKERKRLKNETKL